MSTKRENGLVSEDVDDSPASISTRQNNESSSSPSSTLDKIIVGGYSHTLSVDSAAAASNFNNSSTTTTTKRVHYQIMSSASESSCSSGRHSPDDDDDDDENRSIHRRQHDRNYSDEDAQEKNGCDDEIDGGDGNRSATKNQHHRHHHQQLQRQRSGGSVTATTTGGLKSNHSAPEIVRRNRNISGSMATSEDHFVRWMGKVVYTAGRPSWFDCHGAQLYEPFIIGICGGSASGKTTVAERIIGDLDVQWVILLSMDSFYKVLTEEQHEMALKNQYDFDHPDSFDFDLLRQTLQRLKEGKCVQVPIYNFSTHRREKRSKTIYGATVLIFEGIMAFHMRDVLDMMDLKVFVDTDSDTRLARRLQRDVASRNRDVEGVLDQYNRFVKPAFDSFIAPTMRHADIIIPRGGDNTVAIDLIVRHVKSRLTERECSNRAMLASGEQIPSRDSSVRPNVAPPSLHVLLQTPQVRGLHTFIRNRETSRNEFIFYSNRLMRLLLEYALSFLVFEDTTITTGGGSGGGGSSASDNPPTTYTGKRRRDRICGISILRAGETMEPVLREVVKDCVISKILIQTNPLTQEPELYYLRLPKDVHTYRVFLLDATVATGAAAMMAIRILLDHDVPQENIFLISLLMAETGVHSVAYAFPDVKLITTAVDQKLSKNYHILPGIGNFGDRYFGTEIEKDKKKTTKKTKEKKEEETTKKSSVDGNGDSVFDTSEEEEDRENGDGESGLSSEDSKNHVK